MDPAWARPGWRSSWYDGCVWSYDLLSPDEQRLFRILAALAGGCTLATLEAIYTLLDLLGGLALAENDATQARTLLEEALIISPRTVHAHLCTIYRKIDVTSRFAAISYWNSLQA